jgi:hypothetical protein
MDSRELTKKILRLTAEYGTGVLVYGLLKENSAPPNKLHQKIAVAVAMFALVGIAVDYSSKYTGEFVDQIFDAYEKLKKDLTT